MASECQVGGTGLTVMFAGDNVLNMMRGHGRVGLRQSAIFAAQPGAASDEPTKALLHEAFRGFFNAARAFACKREMKSMARM